MLEARLHESKGGKASGQGRQHQRKEYGSNREGHNEKAHKIPEMGEGEIKNLGSQSHMYKCGSRGHR